MVRKNTKEKEGILSIEKTTSKNYGFTLIEVLVSASVVILLLMGLAQLTLYSLLVKRISDYRMKSSELALSKLEYFKSLPFESEELKEGSGEELLTVNGLKRAYRREWKIQDISPDVKKIEIECYFETCPEKKIRLALFLSRKLGF